MYNFHYWVVDEGVSVVNDQSMKKNPLVKKFSRLLDLTDDEHSILIGLQDECEDIPSDTDLVHVHENYPCTFLIQDGWAYSYILLADGRQQILNFLLRGDFFGLYATVFRRAEHSVRTLTALTVCKIDPERIIELFSKTPRLAAAICWSVAREGAMLGEQVTRIGRRTAYERTGHILLELLNRLEAVDLTESESYEFPVTQHLLADTLGLTPVHINRTLRALKKDGMISYDGKRIVIEEQSQLRKLTEFDPAYLEQTDLPEKIESKIQY